MPSGVDCSDPLVPKCEEGGVKAGLLRPGMLIADVMRAKGGFGEGTRGIRLLMGSPLGSSEAWMATAEK